MNFKYLSTSSILILTSFLLLSACGGGGSSTTTPADPTLQSITISPAKKVLALGADVTLTATGVYSDASEVDISSSVTWSSSDTGVADFSTASTILAISEGTTTVTATVTGVTGTTTLQVIDGLVVYAPYGSESSTTRFDLITEVSKVDVLINLDTTGSMGGELTNLQASLSNIVSDLGATIADPAFGVSHYEDFFLPTHGLSGDIPFELIQRIYTDGIASQNAIDSVTLGNGGDIPESGWEALFQLATGVGNTGTWGSIPAFDPSGSPAAGEEFGTLGGAGFRLGALRTVIWATDAPNQTLYPPPTTYATRSQAVNAAKSLALQVIGIVSGSDATAFNEVLNTSLDTYAQVPPEAWTGARPAGCNAGECCTGLNGAGVSPVGGLCPLTFLVDDNGAGIGDNITTAVDFLKSYGTHSQVTAYLTDDPSDAVDAVAILGSAGFILPDVSTGSPCETYPPTGDFSADGIDDYFSDVIPGDQVCFTIGPGTNNALPAQAEPQIVKGTVQITGGSSNSYTGGNNGVALGSIDIFYVIPATP